MDDSDLNNAIEMEDALWPLGWALISIDLSSDGGRIAVKQTSKRADLDALRSAVDDVVRRRFPDRTVQLSVKEQDPPVE